MKKAIIAICAMGIPALSFGQLQPIANGARKLPEIAGQVSKSMAGTTKALLPSAGAGASINALSKMGELRTPINIPTVPYIPTLEVPYSSMHGNITTPTMTNLSPISQNLGRVYALPPNMGGGFEGAMPPKMTVAPTTSSGGASATLKGAQQNIGPKSTSAEMKTSTGGENPAKVATQFQSQTLPPLTPAVAPQEATLYSQFAKNTMNKVKEVYHNQLGHYKDADEIFAEYANDPQKLRLELTNNVIWTRKNKLRPEQLENVRKDLIAQMKAIEESLPKKTQEYLSFVSVKNNPAQYPVQYNPKHYYNDYANFLNATWNNIQNEWMSGVETMAGLIGLGDKESLQAAVSFAKSFPQKGNDPTNILYRFRDATGMLATRLIDVQPLVVKGKDKLTKELQSAQDALYKEGLTDYTAYETDWHGISKNNPEIEVLASKIYLSNINVVSSNAGADPLHNAYIMLRQRIVSGRIAVEVEHFGVVRKGDEVILKDPKPLIGTPQD